MNIKQKQEDLECLDLLMIQDMVIIYLHKQEDRINL